ncbi:hypothetical protein BU24DRAFT_419166 [Aaosphaeria arxii CBS 175.79]|uniref:Uncharacterized protein n=1 Tax=Aaosphaeria arxii CBS 175.79 TaxID=1450172 RepID=A0A6A5Y2V7_9PLEO|nr:uncharacterized protein BU24DRAFT_419166 [Aaosphaeria arxii CBS 175.79]KAF2019566.1 hypothetical protein BU24DRAFT_419166 [Aaosphaeria arxii CBS 175.79]
MDIPGPINHPLSRTQHIRATTPTILTILANPIPSPSHERKITLIILSISSIHLPSFNTFPPSAPAPAVARARPSHIMHMRSFPLNPTICTRAERVLQDSMASQNTRDTCEVRGSVPIYSLGS